MEKYDTRDEWDYLCHHLLISLSKSKKTDISKTTFYKLICITDRVLRNDFDTDTRFPCYWYQYGEVADPDQINSNIVGIESAEWGGKRVEPTRAVAEHEFDLPDDMKENIFTASKQVAGLFGEKNSEEIRTYQYQHYAPTKFIQAFDKYRNSISELSHTLDEFHKSVDNRSRKDRIGANLEKCISVYPKKKYDMMYDVFLRWEDTSQLLLEKNRYSDLRSLSKSFWTAFCKVETRLHHNRGVSPEKTARWIRERDDVKHMFEEELSTQREELLAGRDTSSLFNLVASSE